MGDTKSDGGNQAQKGNRTGRDLAGADPFATIIWSIGYVLFILAGLVIVLGIASVVLGGDDGDFFRTWYNTYYSRWEPLTGTEVATLLSSAGIAAGTAFSGLLLVGFGRLISFARVSAEENTRAVTELVHLVKVTQTKY